MNSKKIGPFSLTQLLGLVLCLIPALSFAIIPGATVGGKYELFYLWPLGGMVTFVGLIATIYNPAGLILLAIGVVMLDGSGGKQLTLRPLTESEAIELNITNNQLAGFNNRLQVINQIDKIVRKKCVNKLFKSPVLSSPEKVTQEEADFIYDCNVSGWESYQKANPKLISTDTLDVINRLRQHNRQDFSK